METTENIEITGPSLKLSRVFKTWLPLMASWMLMSVELPFINAVVARLANQEINLAAYGGIIYPLALIIEAPIINLLAASTALSRDWDSYQRLKKIMLWMGGALTVIHVLIAFTPLYDFIVNVILHSPAEVVEPGRIGLMFMLPWSASIGYRRFQQGAMIRHGRSRMVGQTTMVRLCVVAVVLGAGYLAKTIPGATLAGMAQGLGVLAEAIYAGIMIKKALPNDQSRAAGAAVVNGEAIHQVLYSVGINFVHWLTLAAVHQRCYLADAETVGVSRSLGGDLRFVLHVPQPGNGA